MSHVSPHKELYPISHYTAVIDVSDVHESVNNPIAPAEMHTIAKANPACCL